MCVWATRRAIRRTSLAAARRGLRARTGPARGQPQPAGGGSVTARRRGEEGERRGAAGGRALSDVSRACLGHVSDVSRVLPSACKPRIPSARCRWNMPVSWVWQPTIPVADAHQPSEKKGVPLRSVAAAEKGANGGRRGALAALPPLEVNEVLRRGRGRWSQPHGHRHRCSCWCGLPRPFCRERGSCAALSAKTTAGGGAC